MPKNVIIHRVEVQVQVEGDDGAVFTRLFNKHIQAWARRCEDESARAERSEGDRRITGGHR